MFEKRVSEKGVTCHECEEWIYPGKSFYRDSWMSFQYLKYRNYCVKCVIKYIRELGKPMKRLRKQRLKLIRLYKKWDKDRCNRCKNRMKSVVGACSPVVHGCKFKEGKYDNTASPAV